jgi:hypothetical protein
MAAANTIGLTYTADIRDIEKKLRALPEETAASARRSVRELTKSLKAVEKQQRRAEKAASGITQGTRAYSRSASQAAQASQSLAMQLPDVVSQLSAGTPPAQVFTQQGLQVVQSNMALTTAAAKAMAGALAGPVGLAMAAAVAAASVLANGLDEVETELAAVRASAEGTYQALDPALILAAASATRTLAEASTAAGDALLSVQAGLTATDAAHIKTVETARESQRVIMRETAARWARLEVQRQELQAAVDSGKLNQADTIAARLRLDALRQEMPAARARIAAVREETEATIAQINADQNETEATKAAAKEKGKHADASRDQAAALRALTEAQAADRAGRSDLLTGLAAEREAREQLAGLQSDLEGGSGNEAIDQANALYERRVELLDQIAERLGYTAELDAAFTEAQAQRDTEVAEAEVRHAEELAKLKADAAMAEQIAAARQLEQMRSSYAGLMGGIADAAGAAAQIIAEENKGAARALFIAAKGAAIAEAIINGAIAKTRALAMLGPVAGPIAAAGITATVAAQVALIASQKPSFNDTPGVIQMPSGGPIGVAPGDMVVAGKDLDDMAAQVDRARGSDRRPMVEVVAIPSYQGRTYDRARRDAYRRPGPDRDAVNRDRANGPGGW